MKLFKFSNIDLLNRIVTIPNGHKLRAAFDPVNFDEDFAGPAIPPEASETFTDVFACVINTVWTLILRQVVIEQVVKPEAMSG